MKPGEVDTSKSGNDIVIFSILRDTKCSECGVEDQRYIEQFASAIQASYPACPGLEALAIARHACQKHSGRVGRSAAAKAMDVEAVDLAVRAHVRHTHSDYDRLLAKGLERLEARSAVADQVAMVMESWRRS